MVVVQGSLIAYPRTKMWIATIIVSGGYIGMSTFLYKTLESLKESVPLGLISDIFTGGRCCGCCRRRLVAVLVNVVAVLYCQTFGGQSSGRNRTYSCMIGL